MTHLPIPLCKYYQPVKTSACGYEPICRCLDTVDLRMDEDKNKPIPVSITCPFKIDKRASKLCKYYEKDDNEKTQLTELIYKMKDVLNEAQLTLSKINK